MDIIENIDLKPFTSFKIGGPAKYFCAVETPEHIQQALDFAKQHNEQLFILGGGSNTLISDSGFSGLVIHPANKGIKTIKQDEHSVTIQIGSAEVWDEIVQLAVSNGWWGIENLSYIPGSAGAIAVQNVGAYGQEASDVIISVEAFDIQKQQTVIISKEQCGFYYRHSIFNTSEKGRYLILNTTIELQMQGDPNLNYPDLKSKFGLDSNTSLQSIREAVIEIRNKKYPFPTEAKGGSAGSFFQNPQLQQTDIDLLDEKITNNFSNEIIQQYQDLKHKFASKKIGLKVSAFLIDICNLKGKQIGGAYINPNQPLVVLNDGTATGQDVMLLVKEVRSEVFAKTGVRIPIEPELVGFTAQELDHYLYLPQ